MKKLLSIVFALLLLTLPLTLGVAETATATASTAAAPLVQYTATDLGFSFYYPQTWSAPVVDSTDTTSLTLNHSADNAAILVKKVANTTMTPEQIVANLDTFKQSILAQNPNATFDDKQSGEMITLPSGKAVQQVYYLTSNNVEVFSALYYLPLGDSLFICQLSVPSSNAQVQTYLQDLGTVLGSLTLL